MNHKLVEYLSNLSYELEAEDSISLDDTAQILNYLYFAPQLERMSLHATERALYGPRIGLSQIQKNIEDIDNFRSYFDQALAAKGITSLTRPFPQSFDKFRASDTTRQHFVKEFDDLQNEVGILNALLLLRNWAFFPDKERGSRNRSRIAKAYFRAVLAPLNVLNDDKEFILFLAWCNKRTRKIFQWGFKSNELRNPPISALPISQQEAANYIKHFLWLTRSGENPLRQQFGEMVIILSLSLACARHCSNAFTFSDLLKINKNNLKEAPSPPEKHHHSYWDIREKSKPRNGISSHDVTYLNLPADFLLNHKQQPFSQVCENKRSPCKAVDVKHKVVLISQPLAKGIELLGEFSLTYKDLENRLSEAYNAVGLIHSSGGICPRCFLCEPHPWPNFDLRKRGSC